MEIRKIIAFTLVLMSATSYAKTKLTPSCREQKDLRVLVDITDHIFDESGTKLVNKVIKKRELVRQYSNLSDVLGHLYFEYNKDSVKPDQLKVMYFHDLKEEKKMRSEFKLKKHKDNLLVVDGFDFKKEYYAKEKYPIIQKFIFMKGKDEVCRISVDQSFELEF